jgi:hypothetical protein
LTIPAKNTSIRLGWTNGAKGGCQIGPRTILKELNQIGGMLKPSAVGATSV